MSQTSEEQEIKEKVNAPWPQIIESIALRIFKIHRHTYTMEELESMDIPALEDFVGNGLAKTTLHFCFEHAVVISLWARNITTFNPVNYNGSIVFCDIIHCSKPAVLELETEVYIASKYPQKLD